MKHFYERVGRVGQQFVAVTDPGSPLVAEAKERRFRRVFENDPEIGGRYSVLSYFGLVPAALMGVDVEALLDRAQVAEQNCAQHDSSENNSGLWLGVAMGELARQGRDKLTFVVSEPISSFGLWVEQLIAESTGKEGKGVLPVADEPLGEPGRLRRRPRVRLPAQRRRARRGAGRPGGGAGQAGQPVVTLSVRGRVRPRPGLLLRGVRHGRGGLGARHQPVRPAERAGGQGQHGQGPGDVGAAGAIGARTTTRCASCSPRPRRRTTWRSWATCSRRPSSTRRSRELRAADPRRDQGHHHVRLRPALPALDRPVPQGRPADGPVPPARARRRRGRARPG